MSTAVTVGRVEINKGYSEGLFIVWAVIGERRTLLRGGFPNYYQAHKWVTQGTYGLRPLPTPGGTA